jgi:tripartite-type tricarboxylate transporter receptor subunit TctC
VAPCPSSPDPVVARRQRCSDCAGLVAPPKTPQGAAAQLAAWAISALQIPEVKAKLLAVGMSPVGLCGRFAAYLRKQHDEYDHVIRAANIKVD